MKTFPLACVLLLLGLCLGAGCSYVEISDVGDPDRTMTGKVMYVPAAPVPEGSVLSIRIVDASNMTNPVLLGQQKIPISGEPPFEFKTGYRADDTLLRRGVNVEAKILVNGKLRYANITNYVVGLSRASGTHEIMVQPFGP